MRDVYVTHRGVLHADREDRPLYRASQSVRPLGPLRGTYEAQDMRSHTPDTTALMQYKYVHASHKYEIVLLSDLKNIRYKISKLF